MPLSATTNPAVHQHRGVLAWGVAHPGPAKEKQKDLVCRDMDRDLLAVVQASSGSVQSGLALPVFRAGSGEPAHPCSMAGKQGHRDDVKMRWQSTN